MWLIFLLAISVSVDTFGIGMAYSMSDIRIPTSTKLMMAITNGLMTFGAIWLGDYLSEYIPVVWFQRGGGILLFGMGMKTLWNALGDNKTTSYDKDNSKVLEPWESALLSITLALDSVSAGFGITGYGRMSYFFPLFTMFAGVTFLSIGECVPVSLRRVNGIGGGVLMCLGLFRFFFG